MGKSKRSTRLADLKKKLNSIKAKDIMTKAVITIREDKVLSEAAELMAKKRITGMPVLNKKGKLLGIIVARDLFLVMDMIESGNIIEQSSIAALEPRVNYVMSKEVVTIRKSANLDKIISIMKYKNIHTLPVTQSKKIIGIIGRRDVYQAFYKVVKEL